MGGVRWAPTQVAQLVPTVVRAEDSAECKKARAAAEQAGREGRPRTVLRETSNAKCWKSHATLRRALRTNAHLDLHDYAACAREGSKSSQADTRALARMCEAKTSKEGQ